MPALFNNPLWAAQLFGGGNNVVQQYPTDLIVFQGFSLSDGTSLITSDLLDSGPTRELIGGNIPRGDGQYINGDFWRERIIEARGYAKAATSADLETLLDTIRKNLRTDQGMLDITRNSVVRRYIATLVNADQLFADRQRYHITLCPFIARFSCKTPFATDRTYTSVMQTVTTSPTNLTIENSGTIHAQPVISLVFDAASSVTVVNIKRLDTNGTTLDEIEYSGSIAAGDVLICDSEQKIVTKNQSQVNFVGGFPSLEPGSNIISITITGTSFSAAVTASSKNAYL